MYHVSTHGVDERMINVHIIIIISTRSERHKPLEFYCSYVTVIEKFGTPYPLKEEEEEEWDFL